MSIYVCCLPVALAVTFRLGVCLVWDLVTCVCVHLVSYMRMCSMCMCTHGRLCTSHGRVRGCIFCLDLYHMYICNRYGRVRGCIFCRRATGG